MGDTNEKKDDVITTEATVEVEEKATIDPAVAAKALVAAQKEIEKEAAKKITTSTSIDDAFASINNADIKALAKILMEVKKDNEKREVLVKRQCYAAICSAALCLILVISILIAGSKFMPTVYQLANDATVLINNTNDLIAQTNDAVKNANDVIQSTTDIIAQTDSIIAQTDAVVANLDTITSDLASIKIQETMDNVNQLVIQSGENMDAAFAQVEAIDIESLNQAITDLQAVIQPLSKLFKK